MEYTVTPLTISNCQCPDCRAGKHLYELSRWVDGEWQFVGASLQGYASAGECKEQHYWGIEFRPDDVWEDGSPVLKPEDDGRSLPEKPQPVNGSKVTLDADALAKSAEALGMHWLR